ncbi:hypothetical protein CVT24_002988 [Panaeolus cyanescens]|uniref:mRNA 3'-end-processing protein RNA14 n=1 Tax=Panaeolus cyanescens TaxID=181874 RepID=A0A409YY33_9AGAR|nr:hypothetical protein CVT24_002988 [Panaeolus cyanescens]
MSATEPNFNVAAAEDYTEDAGDQTQPAEDIMNTIASLKSEPPPSEYESLTAELDQNPHNVDAWRRRVRVAEESGDIEKISATYDALLKQYPNTTTTTWDQQQKMDSLRKVYNRAVQIPLDNVEKLWQELESFETGLNRITAKKFMADLSPGHMQARTVLRQLTNHLSALYTSSPNELHLPVLPRFDASERALVGKWKAYLKWEESNPLEIEEKDKATLITRIQGVYRKAVIRMRYYSEIWFMAYTWTNSVGKGEEALTILKAGLEANPTSFLLTFAYVEALEIKKEYEEVHNTYTRFIDLLRKNLEAMDQQLNQGNTSLTSNGSLAVPQTEPASQNSVAGSQDEKPSKATELQTHRTEFGLAWIMYIRFGRRAEGIRTSRAIFGKARKDKWTPWSVYEAAALMEFHCSDDKDVASRIFEKGLDTFGDEIDYVVRYLAFLISINDQNNARALFERMIPNFPADKARPLWERWARYEYQYGDLEASLKLERRMAEVYASDPPIKRFAQRHMYLGTDAIADRDLGFAMARRGTSSSNGTSTSLGRSETSQSLLNIPSTLNPSSSNNGNTGPSSGRQGGPSTQAQNKRPASPDYGKRDDSRGDFGSGYKRQRPLSPGPGGRGGDRDRERDRDGPGDRRWDGEQRGRGRGFSPAPQGSWEREGRGSGATGRGREGGPRDRDDDKNRQPILPPVLSYFIGDLPQHTSFDGPVFRTDDLMTLFRNAVIPSTGGSGGPGVRGKSPPPPPRSGGRAPPDYGPYQGPNSNPRRRY